MTPTLTKTMYTAHATVTGGRAGHGRTSDGALDVDLRAPVEMGGEGGGTNPEQLFAIGYAACFQSALGGEARREKLDASDSTVNSSVELGPIGGGAFGLAVTLEVLLPSIDQDVAERLVAAAHQRCPYSNATRGNINVTLKVVGADAGHRTAVGE
jgi:osmotically inducible protein OsmC